MERPAVGEQRQKRRDAHRDLQVPQHTHGAAQLIDAPLDPQAAEREAEDERAEHQLEGMRRGA